MVGRTLRLPPKEITMPDPTTHAELAPDLLWCDGLALVKPGRDLRDQEEARELDQIGVDVGPQALGKSVVGGIAAQVDEG